MEFQRFEHIGILFGGLKHRFHDGFLQDAFLDARGVMAVFLAIIHGLFSRVIGKELPFCRRKIGIFFRPFFSMPFGENYVQCFSASVNRF